MSSSVKRVLGMLGVLLLAHIAPGTSYGQQVHPDARFVVKRTSPRPLNLTTRNVAPLFRLDSARSHRIGSEDGVEALGDIAAIVFTRRGDLVLLERGEHVLLVYDSVGRVVQRIGQKGRGPGDFERPMALAVGPSDELAVVDLTRRIQIFERKEGKYVLTRTLRPDLSVRAMCFLRGKLIVNGRIPGDPRVIRVLDPVTGQTLRAFGEIYQSTNSLIDLMLTEGMLACDESADLLVFATQSGLGEIRAYRSDGTHLWEASIVDFKSNKLVENGPGGYTIESSQGGIHALHSLLIAPGGKILAQYSFRSRQELRERVGAKATFTLSLASSSGQPQVTAFNYPVLGALRGRFAATLSNDPFPQVHLVRYSN